MRAGLRPLLVNYADQSGGAARAAFRLLQGLRSAGVDARMLVAERTGRDPAVVGPTTGPARMAAAARRLADRIPLRLAPKRRTHMFSPAWAPGDTARRIRALAPDLVHLHWVAGGMLRIEDLARLRRPIVWTLHDMWPFTGGCHYDEGCGRYADGCGHCPLLGSASARDLSTWVMRRKRRAWGELDVLLVSPSRWLAERARSSRLFCERRVEIVPNGIDLEIFRPMEAGLARSRMGLPQDRKYILFGGVDPVGEKRKGFHLLQAATAALAARGWGERAELLVLGGVAPEPALDLALPARYLGVLKDESSVASAFAAADVVAVPSLEDNLPNIAVETAACGRPCVGFAVGGLPEIVEHGESGYLAEPFEADDLAAGIDRVLGDEVRRARLGAGARKLAEARFDLRVAARRHIELYQERAQAQKGAEQRGSGCAAPTSAS